jgi:8-oxo-dGTP diphosphatase
MSGLMQNIGPEIQVACAIIWCKDHILLSYRDVDAHQGGLWEFPGGKFEPNELPVQCLSRELHEELGIQIGDAYFVCQIPWSYGDKKIRLWVYEVFDFAGVAEGRESQEIDWVHRDALYKRPFPAANMSIVRAVGLPRFARFFGVDRTIAPAFWASQLNNQSLVYFRGVPPSDRLIGGIDAALDHGHSVILTLDQLPCFRIGCGVHFRKSDHPDEVYKALDRVEKPWPVTAGIRNRNDWRCIFYVPSWRYVLSSWNASAWVEWISVISRRSRCSIVCLGRHAIGRSCDGYEAQWIWRGGDKTISVIP